MKNASQYYVVIFAHLSPLVIQMMSPFSLQRAKQESQCNMPSKSHELRITTEPELDQNNNRIDSMGDHDNSDDGDIMRASPFKLDVVRVEKNQCIPIFRAEFVEPRKLLDCKQGFALSIASANTRTISQALKIDKHVLGVPQGDIYQQSTTTDDSRTTSWSTDETNREKVTPHIEESSMTALGDSIQSSATSSDYRTRSSSADEKWQRKVKPLIGETSTIEMGDRIRHLTITDNCRTTTSSANKRCQQNAEPHEVPTEMDQNSRQMLLGANNRPVFFIQRYTKESLVMSRSRSRSFNEKDLLEKSENGKTCITNNRLRPRLKYRTYSGGISVKPRTNSRHGQVIIVNDPEEYERFEDSQSAKDSKDS
eukprot:Seg6004.2 transcript_id=Seg6004.2/GoldUCD/mRNA.D3Y31 product="hypothetical protein" protein_id=Seg6004.2/GoldUCD/D3Y31